MLTVNRMHEMERQVSCPFCKTPTRVTEGELIDKRGFCAWCDARFDLVPEMFVADGPHRTAAMIASSLPALAPTSKMAIARDTDDHEVITVSSARPFPLRLGLFTVFWVGFLVFWYANAIARPDLVSLVFPLLHVAIGVGMARKVLLEVRGRERLRFGDDALTLVRRGALLIRTRSVRYDDIVAVRVEAQPRPIWERNSFWSSRPSDQRVLLLRAGADPVYVADGLGHSVDAAAWLAAWIERTARSARRRGAEARPLTRGHRDGEPGK
jgi:hypothetical protein